jgi:hypothetical protein
MSTDTTIWPDINTIRTQTKAMDAANRAGRISRARKDIAFRIKKAAATGVYEVLYTFTAKSDLLTIQEELLKEGFTALYVDLDLCISW